MNLGRMRSLIGTKLTTFSSKESGKRSTNSHFATFATLTLTKFYSCKRATLATLTFTNSCFHKLDLSFTMAKRKIKTESATTPLKRKRSKTTKEEEEAKTAFATTLHARLAKTKVHPTRKLNFIKAYPSARIETFKSDTIKNSYGSAGLVPFKPDRVLSKLNIRLRTLSPTLSRESE